MAIVRLVITILGALCLLMGLLWIGQGLGYVRWPQSSFMIGAAEWATRGAILVVLGAVMIAIARRLRR